MNPYFWKGMLVGCVIMLAVLGASFAFVDTDSTTFVITVSRRFTCSPR